MDKTKIEWADSTWNPVTGCLNDCEYCYARRLAHRFCSQSWGATRGLYILNEPMQFDNSPGGDYDIPQYTKEPYPYEFDPTFHRYRLGNYKKKMKPRTIFVCSMADMFGDWIPDEWIEEVFRACEDAPQHRYLFLTKNPDRYIKLAQKKLLPKNNNFWYGSTVTTKDDIYWYCKNRQTFVSIEPIMSDFGDASNIDKEGINWVIIGAETGNRKDKIVPKKEWIDNIVEECDKVNVPVFMKDSLIEIVGEENMRRELPWKDK